MPQAQTQTESWKTAPSMPQAETAVDARPAAPPEPGQFERSPIHVANYLLWLAERDGVRDMTPMKLLKLVYFSYAWFLVLMDEELFAEKVEAWKFGPVVPSLYHEFKRFGNRHITEYAEFYDDPDDSPQYPILDADDRYAWRITAAVWRNYRRLNGTRLSAITHHADSPWREAYARGNNAPIDKTNMREWADRAIDVYLAKVKGGEL